MRKKTRRHPRIRPDRTDGETFGIIFAIIIVVFFVINLESTVNKKHEKQRALHKPCEDICLDQGYTRHMYNILRDTGRCFCDTTATAKEMK